MKAHYWAGYITPNVILQHSNIATWAVGWLLKAQKAEMEGKELVVFEVPVNDRLHALEGIEGYLQNDYELLQSSARDLETTIDMQFIHNLMMPPDAI